MEYTVESADTVHARLTEHDVQMIITAVADITRHWHAQAFGTESDTPKVLAEQQHAAWAKLLDKLQEI